MPKWVGDCTMPRSVVGSEENWTGRRSIDVETREDAESGLKRKVSVELTGSAMYSKYVTVKDLGKVPCP